MLPTVSVVRELNNVLTGTPWLPKNAHHDATGAPDGHGHKGCFASHHLPTCPHHVCSDTSRAECFASWFAYSLLPPSHPVHTSSDCQLCVHHAAEHTCGFTIAPWPVGDLAKGNIGPFDSATGLPTLPVFEESLRLVAGAIPSTRLCVFVRTNSIKAAIASPHMRRLAEEAHGEQVNETAPLWAEDTTYSQEPLDSIPWASTRLHEEAHEERLLGQGARTQYPNWLKEAWARNVVNRYFVHLRVASGWPGAERTSTVIYYEALQLDTVGTMREVLALKHNIIT